MPDHFTTIAICSPGYDFNCDNFNEQYGKTNLCELLMPMPKEVEASAGTPVTRDSDNNVQMPAWYDWARENWGTKWGAYDVKAFALGGDASPVVIKFQSAWVPPKILDKIAEWLMKEFEFERVVWIGFDPYDDSTSILESQESTK